MLRMWTPGRRNASAELRWRLPQSRNTMVRSSTSSGGADTRLVSGRKRYSWGSGRSRPSMNIRQSLPIASSRPCTATSDPIASPSGCSCVTTTSLSASRSSARTWSRSARLPLVIISTPVAGLIVDQARDPHAAIHRFVVFEGQGGRVLEGQLGCDPALQKPMRRSQALEAGLALGGVAEHAHVHTSVAQIRAGLDSGYGHETHAGVL